MARRIIIIIIIINNNNLILYLSELIFYNYFYNLNNISNIS